MNINETMALQEQESARKLRQAIEDIAKRRTSDPEKIKSNKLSYRNLSTCLVNPHIPLDDFKSLLQLFSDKALQADSWSASWWSDIPERNQLVRDQIFAQAKDKICLYIPELSLDWARPLEDCISRDLTTIVICDQTPNPESYCYKILKDHIETSPKSLIGVKKPFLDTYLDMTYRRGKPESLICCETAGLIDWTLDQSSTLASFGASKDDNHYYISHFFREHSYSFCDVLEGPPKPPKPPKPKGFFTRLFN